MNPEYAISEAFDKIVNFKLEPEDLLEILNGLYDRGYNQGYEDGQESGYSVGWESGYASRQES